MALNNLYNKLDFLKILTLLIWYENLLDEDNSNKAHENLNKDVPNILVKKF
jgi:hypothetical protein